MRLSRLHAGGNWNNSSYCGPRCVNLNNVSANVNANNGGRGASDTRSLDLTPRLNIKAASPIGETHSGGYHWLVAVSESQ